MDEKRTEETRGENKEVSLKDKHESDLTPKEKRLLEKEKLQSMGIMGKLEYIWMYYKPAIFGVIGAIVLIFVGIDLYQNAQIEEVLNVAVINAGLGDPTALSEEIREIIGAEGENQEVSVQTNLVTNAEGDDFDYYSRMAYVAKIQTQEIDILIMPEQTYEALLKDGAFADMKETLGEELYASFGDSVDETHLTVDSSILGSELAVDYDPLCICVMANARNPENAVKWLASLAE
ncbi:MAG: hypothetical protein Q4C91_16635 [Eubacteriales bacterium]|nr:hypothetical protein [Eubacteriales bacterium]